MSTAYVPIVEIQLQNDEDPSTFYTFNPSHFQYGSQSVTLDYFNSLILQQQQEDEAAAQATADQIAAQASSMASSDALLASGIAITQSFLSANSANDVVQSDLITALEGNVSILQDNFVDLSNSRTDYALLLDPIFSNRITTTDLSMNGNIILADESIISQTQLSFLSTLEFNVQDQFADISSAISQQGTDIGTLEISIHDQIVDISGSIADIGAEVSTNSGDIIAIQSTSSANAGNITLLQSYVETNTDDISSINDAIALRAQIDNPVFTTQVTCPQITLNGSIITNSTNISPTELSYLNGISSNIQSQIDAATANIALKCPTNNAALTGTPTCPDVSAGDASTKIANCNFVSSAISSLISGAPGALDSLQELANALGNDSNYSTTITTALATKAPILNASMTGNTSFANIAVSGTTSFPVTSISSAAIDNTHFATLTTAQTISGSKAFTALSTVNKMCENFYSMGILGSSTASIDFANGSCFYMTPMSSANLTLAVSNVPTTNNSCAYSITSMINTSTYKVYGNVCSVNGSGVTLVASGGLSSISVDPSASFVIQQLNIMFDGSSNPSRVISSVNSFF